MLTRLGKLLRSIRISRGENLRDMATKLEVSSAFLSAVENGKKKLPESWGSKLQNLYSLSPQQLSEIKDAAMESSDTISLSLRDASDESRQLAVSFARKFNSLDDETAKKIFSILQKHKED